MKKRAREKSTDGPRVGDAAHPYMKYKSHPYWRRINKGIAGLVKNGDLVEQTSRDYIVGQLCKTLIARLKSEM